MVETNKQGIVSFITAASYLRGPGFAAMREHMCKAFDEIWIIDLEGDNLGTRKTENVFQIQSPVAIAIGVRYAETKTNPLAKAHYTRLQGAREEKLAQLKTVEHFADFDWRECLPGSTDPFLPISKSDYWNFPLLTDLFPWQENGAKSGRAWPIAADKTVLEKRWKALLESSNRKNLFKDSPTGRKSHQSAPALAPNTGSLPPLAKISQDTELPDVIRFAYRSFDRQWLIADGRLIDRPSPTLWRAHSQRQLYLTSLLTSVLGEGPAAMVSNLLPDLHHFRGSFGGKDVIPLWQNANFAAPNLTCGLLETLQNAYGQPVSAEDFFAYAYAILFTPLYVKQYWDELSIPGARLPITKDAALFAESVQLGKKLIWLHTYGERFAPEDQPAGRVPQGQTRCAAGTPSAPEKYPETFRYDEAAQQLHVGEGLFSSLRPAVWNFSVSGLQVVKSWLGYRMKERSGKKSSPLDALRPASWAFDNELLDLLWVLDNTIDLLPIVNRNFEKVLQSALFHAQNFPKPSQQEHHSKTTLSLFDFAGVYVSGSPAEDEKPEE